MDDIPLSPRRRLTYLESRERTFFSHKSPTILSLKDTKNKVRLVFFLQQIIYHFDILEHK